MPLKFDETICPQNHRCQLIDTCPAEAISQDNSNSLPYYDNQKCLKCGQCVEQCKMGAVSVIKLM